VSPTRYGSGDPETWGPATDNPNDPRNDFDDDDDEGDFDRVCLDDALADYLEDEGATCD
jgi:hypothetical protein